MQPRRPATANIRRTALAAAAGLVLGAGLVGVALAADPMQGLQLPSLVLPVQDETDTRVLPVWNNESGRMEGLLLLDAPIHGGLNPLDRLLGNDGGAPGLGIRLNLGDGSRVQSALQFERDAGLALLCNGSVGMASALGTLGQDCLLASLGDSDLLPRSSTPGVTLGADWRAADGGVDLSFGLSWLSSTFSDPRSSLYDDSNSPWLGSLPLSSSMSSNLLSGLAGAHMDAQQVHLGASMNFSAERWMSLVGSLASQRFTAASGLPLQWETATVTLGVGYRGLTGQLTGRLLELPAQNASWSGIDLGLSWRTSWQGELSVGARNLWRSGGRDNTAAWPLSDLPAMVEDPSVRVPYVRYKQDL